jgi:urate oxidase
MCLDTKDRVFSTKVKSFWKYFDQESVDLTEFESRKINFSDVFNKNLVHVMKGFAGPADSGVYSPSVQFTIYQIGQSILKALPEVSSFSMELPNIHYYLVDFSQFKTDLKNNNEVFFTFDGAHGQIEATIVRSKEQTKSSTSKAKL